MSSAPGRSGRWCWAAGWARPRASGTRVSCPRTASSTSTSMPAPSGPPIPRPARSASRRRSAPSWRRSCLWCRPAAAGVAGPGLAVPRALTPRRRGAVRPAVLMDAVQRVDRGGERCPGAHGVGQRLRLRQSPPALRRGRPLSLVGGVGIDGPHGVRRRRRRRGHGKEGGRNCGRRRHAHEQRDQHRRGCAGRPRCGSSSTTPASASCATA